MRIVYVTRRWTVHDRRFVQGLLGAGHEVVYRAVERLPEAALREMQQNRVLSARDWRAAGASFWPRLPWMVRDLRRLVREFQPDLIHAGPIQQGAFVAALAGFHPLASMSWGSDLLRDARAGRDRWLASFVLRRSNVLVCDCETVRARAIDLGMDPERICVFPWGVELDVFSPTAKSEIRRSLGWEGCLVLMSARPWEPVYGTHLVAEAFATAAASEADLRLLMLGEGSQRRRIRRRLESGEAIRRTHFPGPVEHAGLPAYFRAADLYLSASRSDGSSVTLLEAMASGLPALVSDIPSNREWVEDGANGWTFRDGDPASLAGAILRAAQDRGRLGAMGRAARAVTEARADWSKNFPRLDQAYRMAQHHSMTRPNGG